jgi:hypothetical protein
VDGDGRQDVVILSGVGRRPGACRALLTVRLARGTVHRILPMPYQADGITGTTLDAWFTPFLMGLGPIDRRAGDEVVATLHSGASTATASVFTLRRGAIVQELLRRPVKWLAYNGSVQDDFSVSCHRGGVVWQSSIGWTGPKGWNVAHEERAVYRADGRRFVLTRRIVRTTYLRSLRERKRFRPRFPVPPDFAGCFTTRGTVPPD